jgi:sodium transport system permease protein
LSQSANERRLRGAVLRNELRGLLRDRRALFSAFVLPLLLYPLLFLGQGWLQRVSEETLDAKEVSVAYELSAAPVEQRTRLLELLEAQVPIRLRELAAGSTGAIQAAIDEGTEAAWFRERELALDLLDDPHQALLYATPDPDSPRGTLYRIHFDGADDRAREAADRTGTTLDELREELREERLDELLGEDPAAVLLLVNRDLASEEDLGGALLGRILPLILVMVLLSGGSYAALSAFPGERETGTLETLLVQPVPSSAIVWGKFSAVLIAGLTAVTLNLGSLLGSVALGLGELPGSSGEVGGPGLLRFLLGVGLLLPLCLLVSSVLCLVCGRAQSFRAGQQYLLPLSLAGMVPAALALRPEIELDALLACVPLAGPALAFREALVGQLTVLPGALALGTTLLYSALFLRKLSAIFDGERVLAGEGSEEEVAGRHVQSRAAIAWGWTGVLAVYLVGGLAQSAHAVYGLIATLWLLLPTLGYFAVRRTAERAGESMRAALWLRLPRPSHLCAALLAAPALARLASVWIEWQQRVLPLPSSMTSGSGLPPELTELSTGWMFVALALSPGICEELFFRGAVLSGLRRDLSAWRSVFWQALLFGAVHASIYRFAPTATLGALLAALTLRSRSLLPAMVLHISYNGLLVLGSESGWFQAPWVPWLLLPAVLFALVPSREARA